MKNAPQAQQAPAGFDPTANRYTGVDKALRAVRGVEDFPQGDIDQLHVEFLANGEVIYRVREVGSEDPLVGSLLPE